MFVLNGPAEKTSLHASNTYEAVGAALGHMHHSENVRTGQVFRLYDNGSIVATFTVNPTGANVDFFIGKN